MRNEDEKGRTHALMRGMRHVIRLVHEIHLALDERLVFPRASLGSNRVAAFVRETPIREVAIQLKCRVQSACRRLKHHIQSMAFN